MTTTTTGSGLIDVGTATLYHEVRGSGPALLLITGGTGDAGLWDGHVSLNNERLGVQVGEAIEGCL